MGEQFFKHRFKWQSVHQVTKVAIWLKRFYVSIFSYDKQKDLSFSFDASLQNFKRLLVPDLPDFQKIA
jgi:hypothetical protein